LSYADHDLRLDLALEFSRKDLVVRKDIYAWDTLAWALFKNNHLTEAASAMTEARKLGAPNARQKFNAGMIHFRSGRMGKARTLLRGALALKPALSVLDVDLATRTLMQIDDRALASKSQPRSK